MILFKRSFVDFYEFVNNINGFISVVINYFNVFVDDSVKISDIFNNDFVNSFQDSYDFIDVIIYYLNVFVYHSVDIFSVSINKFVVNFQSFYDFDNH